MMHNMKATMQGYLKVLSNIYIYTIYIYVIGKGLSFFNLLVNARTILSLWCLLPREKGNNPCCGISQYCRHALCPNTGRHSAFRYSILFLFQHLCWKTNRPFYSKSHIQCYLVMDIFSVSGFVFFRGGLFFT